MGWFDTEFLKQFGQLHDNLSISDQFESILFLLKYWLQLDEDPVRVFETLLNIGAQLISLLKEFGFEICVLLLQDDYDSD